MGEKRQVSVEEGEDKSKKENIMFIESSAKAGYNVKALFKKLAGALPGQEAPQQAPAASLIDIKLTPTSKKASGSSSATGDETSGSGCMC